MKPKLPGVSFLYGVVLVSFLKCTHPFLSFMIIFDLKIKLNLLLIFLLTFFYYFTMLSQRLEHPDSIKFWYELTFPTFIYFKFIYSFDNFCIHLYTYSKLQTALLLLFLCSICHFCIICTILFLVLHFFQPKIFPLNNFLWYFSHSRLPDKNSVLRETSL